MWPLFLVKGLRIMQEQFLTLTQAADLLPTRPHVSTLWRWARKGLKGIRLEYRRMGGRVYTSAQALDRFGARLAALDDNPPAPAPKVRRTPAERARAVAAASAKLQGRR